MNNYPGSTISILDLTRLTSILVEDVIATLQMLGLLVQIDDDPHNIVVHCPAGHLTNLLAKYPVGFMQVSIHSHETD